MQDHSPAILVATCGNVMAADDAFGPSVAREFRREELPGVEVIDLDIRPAALLDYLDGRTGLIIVDAAYAPGLQAGRVIDTDWFSPERPALVNDDALSSHGLSIAVQLDLAQRLGILPRRVRLIAATIAPARVGQPASDRLPGLVICAVNLVRMHAERWSASILEPEYA